MNELKRIVIEEIGCKFSGLPPVRKGREIPNGHKCISGLWLDAERLTKVDLQNLVSCNCTQLGPVYALFWGLLLPFPVWFFWHISLSIQKQREETKMP